MITLIIDLVICIVGIFCLIEVGYYIDIFIDKLLK